MSECPTSAHKSPVSVADAEDPSKDGLSCEFEWIQCDPNGVCLEEEEWDSHMDPKVNAPQKAEKKRAGWRLLIRIMIASWFFASALRIFNVEGEGQWDAWLSKQSRYVMSAVYGQRC